MPSVTVAVSTFKESNFEWILELLRSLEDQTLKDFRVIVVVNRNESYFNKLFDAVKSETRISHGIDVIFNVVDKGIAHSRNIALRNAKTPYVAYTDDDVVVDVHWLEELVRTLGLSKKVVAATGPVLCKWEADAEEYASWFPKELYWVISCTPWNITEITKVRNGFASNMALRREVALKFGGFNEKFGYNPRDPVAGEEPEFGVRLARRGYDTLWNPSAMVYHRIPRDRLGVGILLRRSLMEGKTKARLSRILGSVAMKTEADQFKSVIRAFVETGSLKSKALLLLTTFAVLVSYLKSKPKLFG